MGSMPFVQGNPKIALRELHEYLCISSMLHKLMGSGTGNGTGRDSVLFFGN